MTGRERFLTAMRGGIPDRVPATPDISNYIPAKRTGFPYWDIYFGTDMPLWKAYIEAADAFGIDPWISSCFGAPFIKDESKAEESVVLHYDAGRDAMLRETKVRTPDGDLNQTELCFRADPPTPVKKFANDLVRDWKALRHLMVPPVGMDHTEVDRIRKACGARNAAFGLGIGYPGFHSWYGWVQDGITQLSYAAMDQPELLDEWFELDLVKSLAELELVLAEKPDYVTLGGSGTLTMSNPEYVRRWTLPAVAEMTRRCKLAGVPTVLHTCGKSRLLADYFAEETDLDCINPLEIAPMGDVDLAELKSARGASIALMGNLHTTKVMLSGTPDEVYAAAVAAMRAAGRGGGFILSTGDQCPRETPDENLRAFVAAAVERGTYAADGSLPGLD